MLLPVVLPAAAVAVVLLFRSRRYLTLMKCIATSRSAASLARADSLSGTETRSPSFHRIRRASSEPRLAQPARRSSNASRSNAEPSPATASILACKEHPPPHVKEPPSVFLHTTLSSDSLALPNNEPSFPDEDIQHRSEPHGTLLLQHASWVVSSLPPLSQLSEFQLVFSTLRDGWNLRTLLHHSEAAPQRGPQLLILRDQADGVFGACINIPLRKRQPGSGSYGNAGESHVFTLYPERSLYRWSARDRTCCTGLPSGGIAIGGPPDFAIALDNDLHFGSSGPYCSTFDSPCLSAEGTSFHIDRVELYSAFGRSSVAYR